MGAINFNLDIPTNRDASKLASLLQSCGMQQHVHEATHVRCHTLDVVITRGNSCFVSDINVTDPGICDSTGNVSRDHFAVAFKACASKPAPVRKTVSFEKLGYINATSFKQDIVKSDIHVLRILGTSFEKLVDAYAKGLCL